jgi:type I site-specific restriction endonuclease
LELEEVSYHFDTADLLHLLKKLLRNTRNLSNMIDQVESVSDFLKDATPLGKQVVNQLMETLQELDRKGYFDFFRESIKILDTVVTTFSVEDVRLFRENVVSILLTLKNLTQPEMLSTVDNALRFFKKWMW